jgi:hypothetical protein
MPAGLLHVLKQPQAAPYLLLRIFPDSAGVDKDHVSHFQVRRLAVSALAENCQNNLRTHAQMRLPSESCILMRLAEAHIRRSTAAQWAAMAGSSLPLNRWYSSGSRTSPRTPFCVLVMRPAARQFRPALRPPRLAEPLPVRGSA